MALIAAYAAIRREAGVKPAWRLNVVIPSRVDRCSFHRDYFGARQGAPCAVVPRTSSKAQIIGDSIYLISLEVEIKYILSPIILKEPGLRWHEMGTYHRRVVSSGECRLVSLTHEEAAALTRDLFVSVS